MNALKYTTDMAITNLPLSKRGNIDKQLDAYKRDKAQEEKVADRARIDARSASKAEAKALAHLLPDMVKWQAAKNTGMSVKDIKIFLDGLVKWEPGKFVKFAKEYQSTLSIDTVPVEAVQETTETTGTTEAVSTPLLPQTASPALLEAMAKGMREHKAKEAKEANGYTRILSVKVDFDKIDTVTLEVAALFNILNNVKGLLQDIVGMNEDRDRQLSAVDVSLETLRSMERVARERDIQKRRRSRMKAQA